MYTLREQEQWKRSGDRSLPWNASQPSPVVRQPFPPSYVHFPLFYFFYFFFVRTGWNNLPEGGEQSSFLNLCRRGNSGFFEGDWVSRGSREMICSLLSGVSKWMISRNFRRLRQNLNIAGARRLFIPDGNDRDANVYFIFGERLKYMYVYIHWKRIYLETFQKGNFQTLYEIYPLHTNALCKLVFSFFFFFFANVRYYASAPRSARVSTEILNHDVSIWKVESVCP